MKTKKKTVSTGTLDVRWPSPFEGDFGAILFGNGDAMAVVTKRNDAGDLYTAPFEKPEVLTFPSGGGVAKTGQLIAFLPLKASAQS